MAIPPMMNSFCNACALVLYRNTVSVIVFISLRCAINVRLVLQGTAELLSCYFLFLRITADILFYSLFLSLFFFGVCVFDIDSAKFCERIRSVRCCR